MIGVEKNGQSQIEAVKAVISNRFYRVVLLIWGKVKKYSDILQLEYND